MKNALEHKLENSHKENYMNPMNNNTCNTFMISNKFECDAAKHKVDHKYENHQKVNGKQSAFGAKVKERPSGLKVANQLLATLPMVENNIAPKMTSSARVPQVITEDCNGKIEMQQHTRYLLAPSCISTLSGSHTQQH